MHILMLDMMQKFVKILFKDFVLKESRCVERIYFTCFFRFYIQLNFKLITQCSKQHVLLCPQFESMGRCPRGKQCHLTHRRKRNETNNIKLKSKWEFYFPIFFVYNSFYFFNIRPVEESSTLPNVMPAYIPLSQGYRKRRSGSIEIFFGFCIYLEQEKKSAPVEFKLKPSFLS